MKLKLKELHFSDDKSKLTFYICYKIWIFNEREAEDGLRVSVTVVSIVKDCEKWISSEAHRKPNTHIHIPPIVKKDMFGLW